MAQHYTVLTEGTLLPFLFSTLEGWSKKTIKQRLKGGSIRVNGNVQTRHDHKLSSGDIVQIGAISQVANADNVPNEKLEILYQDQHLVAINKPAGLLSVGTSRENRNHALARLRRQLSRGKNSVKLWPVHRLDRDTSGVMLFATSKSVREAVMEAWSQTEKVYLAVVEGTPKAKADTITQSLRRDETEYHMHVGEHQDAKRAITHYNVLQSTATHSLVEVQIETGRQHQIRAHMAWMGHPVVGDERYGKKGKRMGLHAKSLTFIHPVHHRQISLELEPPSDFLALLD